MIFRKDPLSLSSLAFVSTTSTLSASSSKPLNTLPYTSPVSAIARARFRRTICRAERGFEKSITMNAAVKPGHSCQYTSN